MKLVKNMEIRPSKNMKNCSNNSCVEGLTAHTVTTLVNCSINSSIFTFFISNLNLKNIFYKN